MLEKLVSAVSSVFQATEPTAQNPTVYRSTTEMADEVVPEVTAEAAAEAPVVETAETPVEAVPVVEAPVAPVEKKHMFDEVKDGFVSFEEKLNSYKETIAAKEAAIIALYEEIVASLDGMSAELTQFKTDHLS